MEIELSKRNEFTFEVDDDMGCVEGLDMVMVVTRVTSVHVGQMTYGGSVYS